MNLTVASSPHIRGNFRTNRIMLDVVLALLPALAVGAYMMGIAQRDLSVPVVKATNSILCLLKDVNGAAENPVCLRCGKCVSVCPMRLQPLYMYRFVNANRLDQLERLHVMDCMECGSCAFTCPGKLPLVEQFRKGKKLLKEANAK